MTTFDTTAKEAILTAAGKGEGFAIEKLAELMAPFSAAATPDTNARYLGDKWIKTDTGKVYIAVAVGSGTPSSDWAIVN